MWTLTNGPLDAVADNATGALKLLTGWTGLGLVSLAGGLISGVAEALGASFNTLFRHKLVSLSLLACNSPGLVLINYLFLDLGSLDDNLTLPIISGGCIWGLFKLLEFATSYFS